MNNKKAKILTIVGIVTLLLIVVGATFAYFIAQNNSPSSKDVEVKTNTTDSLVFDVSDFPKIEANQGNFYEGAGNKKENAKVKATLRANNATNNATYSYYVYLNVEKNEFTYTTDEKTAELILTITDKEGIPLTAVKGLKYVTVGEVSGFDITEATGVITLLNNQEIKNDDSTTPAEQEWNVEVTLINLPTNQSSNAGKHFDAKLIIQKEKIATEISEVCKEGNVLADCIKTLGNNRNYSESNVYLHDSKLFNGAEDNNYRYAGGDYSVALAYQNKYTKIGTVSAGDTDAIIGFMCDGAENYVGVACQGEYYFFLTYEEGSAKTQYKTYEEAINQAINDGYIEETPVKNFVCFGDDCSNYDNLYRIIGVYKERIVNEDDTDSGLQEDRVKLIKADYANKDLLGEDGDYNATSYLKTEYPRYQGVHELIDKYYWNASTDDGGTGKNNWRESRLNVINLNTNYLNNIESWENKISKSLWTITGDGLGNKSFITSNAKTVFDYELGKNKLPVAGYEPYEAKVGLPYASDYMYAASLSSWSLIGYSIKDATKGYRSAKDNNWLYTGIPFWTISPRSEKQVYSISNLGNINHKTVITSTINGGIRPTFYLNSNVTYISGEGTQANPIRIN